MPILGNLLRFLHVEFATNRLFVLVVITCRLQEIFVSTNQHYTIVYVNNQFHVNMIHYITLTEISQLTLIYSAMILYILIYLMQCHQLKDKNTDVF